MKDAYLQTIRDFEIALEAETSIFGYNRRKWLNEQIDHYQGLLDELNKQEKETV